MTPTWLAYHSATHIQSHMCGSEEIADAVQEYIRGRYDALPKERSSCGHIGLDPGGAVFGTNLPLRETEILGVTYRLHPCHVGQILEALALRHRPRYRGRMRMRYGSIDVFRMAGMFRLYVLPVEHLVPLEEWLLSHEAESKLIIDEHYRKLRDGDCKVILPKSPVPEIS